MNALNLFHDDTSIDVQPAQKPYERVVCALKAGQLQEALNVLEELDKPQLMEAVLRAGFGLGPTKKKRDIFNDLQPQILLAAKLKMDGFELREHKKGMM